MNNKKKLMALALSAAMAVGSFSAGTTALAADGDTQSMHIATTAFGNNYDVQDMGWRWMMAACYEGLYRNVADEENGEQFILAGAESVDISDDGTVYTFHLREDAKWSDGVAVTAADYYYGWTRLITADYGYSYASYLFGVVGAEDYYTGAGSLDDVGIKVIDDYTFEVTLSVADPTFISKLVATPLYPTREDIAEAAGDAWGSDWTLCVYNGPFCMTSMVEDNTMVWSKNEYYWDVENTGLDEVVWYVVDQDSTKATMFDNGEIDLLQTSGDYLTKYEAEAESGEIQMIVTPYPGTIGLVFNCTESGGASGLMSNTKIRKAISYCINREDMIEGVYGRYEAAYGYVSPAITFDGSIYRDLVEEPTKTEYDEYVGNSEAIQALFQEGLDELGVDTAISDITITYLCYSTSSEYQAESEYIQQIIQQTLGCKVELNAVGESALFKAEREAGNYDMMYSGWYSDYNDPLDFLYTFYTGAYGEYNFGGYSNAEYDALIDSLTGETDNAVRLEIYEKAETILLDEDCAFVPIYYSTKTYFLQNWVQNFRWSSFGASIEPYITYIDGRGY